MGTFLGHVVPGSCFILVSLWWTFIVYRNYYKSLCTGKKFRSSTWFPLDEYQNFPLECLVKLVLVVIGITGETVTGFNDNGVFIHINNGQHITMFFFFGIQSVVEILQFYKFPSIPNNTEYFTSIMGYFMEALLFCFHLHGRSHLDVLVHTLLVVAIAGCCVTTFIETFVRNDVIVTLARAFCTFLQGTWFYHVGFILYPPLPGMKQWNEGDHSEMLLVVMYFTWHAAADFAIMLLIGSLVSLKYRRMLNSKELNDSCRLSLLRKEKSEFLPLNQVESDSDEV